MTHKIHLGSNLDILPTLPDNSVDSIVTDPPYELGFMGKSWDSTGIAYNVEVWKQCLRVLKPGGHLVAFSGSRTYHRMAVAIEDAGFQIRDQMMWVYGSGFPKSHNIGKAVDKLQGNERKIINEGKSIGHSTENSFRSMNESVKGYNSAEFKIGFKDIGFSEHEGWGTALKPAHEPIVLARKPLEKGLSVAENVLKWGVGGINIDGCRVGTEGGCAVAGAVAGAGARVFGKGLNETFAKPVAGLGRFPANLMHDGSQEVLDLFPESNGGAAPKKANDISTLYEGGWKGIEREERVEFGKGSAARFFYCPKANKKDRDEGCGDLESKRTSKLTGSNNDKQILDDVSERLRTMPSKNNHPTVKPTDLMRYLCRLVTPPNGIVLDPFSGSGSTGKAAVLGGFNYIGIELDPEYIKISEARINFAIKK